MAARTTPPEAAPEGISSALEDERLALERTWRDPGGVVGWFTQANHRAIGRRFIVTAFVFFGLGGILALLMRLQLARPGNHFLSADFYNQAFTTHGSTMMFLFAVPVMEAFAVYLVPLMVGTRQIAFPRLNAYGYYIYVFGGIMLYVGLLLNIGPDAGWFAYVPLSGPGFSPGKRVDFWAQMITFTEVSAIVVSVEIIVTIFKLRAPGMSLNRMPLFAWSMLVTSFMVLFAMPAVMFSSTTLIMDRLIGTHFYNPAEGGDALLWQHLFWFFGHPEVYIIFIPALGMVSSIIAAFSRRHVFGYPAIVLSLAATGLIGFGLWVHHMFATGLPQLGESFFTAASMMIAIPTGAQFFCWIATLWTGRVWVRAPMLFVIGFFVNFLIGGLTGVMLASVPLNLQVHDTFFVVAHLHYVLIGGSVFPLFGGVYYWFPKISGRMLGERLGRFNFWTLLIGFNLTFFPMHILGLEGMPRRVYTYRPDLGWNTWNLLATIGAFILAVSVISFIVNVLRSLKYGEVAGDNPWNAGTLEWATTSPPPAYNFLRIPTVGGREPVWDNSDTQPEVVGLRTDVREVLVTHLMDAEPDHRFIMPGPSIWPLLAAVTTTILFIGSIFTPWAVVWGSIPVAITLVAWFWPSWREARKEGLWHGKTV